jgi:bifunctional DNase/RNase
VYLEKVKIRRVIGPTPSGAAILLGNDKKTFVVFVGFYEAAALIREINHESPARPLTHELIQSVFLGFDIEVKKVIISSIIENTFCATLVLQQKVADGNEEWAGKRNEVRIDARPSDCLVLALKSHVDIYVTHEVFDQVQDVSKMTGELEGNLAGMNMGDLEAELRGPGGGPGPGHAGVEGEPDEEMTDELGEDDHDRKDS